QVSVLASASALTAVVAVQHLRPNPYRSRVAVPTAKGPTRRMRKMGGHWLSAPLAIAGITLVTSAASADPTDQAIDAARAGDFGTALGILVPEAGDGNAHAEFVLGILYEDGLGVAKDTGEAADLY